jgi:hypothetical protein
VLINAKFTHKIIRMADISSSYCCYYHCTAISDFRIEASSNTANLLM